MKAIIINGGSCSGKSTISKEICSQSNNKFVHLQIDKTGQFFGTIFPNGFKFGENELGTDANDDGLRGLFNNNRLARRKVVASLYISAANSLLSNNFNVVLDTSLDGPDAKELARFYIDNLACNDIKFIGIFCPLEEKLKRLKTRTDNLFLTEDFIKMQTEKYNPFEDCKEFYHQWFDSSLMSGKQISELILSQYQELNKNID
jgi:chloramphenicol 3-O phosphotransferase